MSQLFSTRDSKGTRSFFLRGISCRSGIVSGAGRLSSRGAFVDRRTPGPMIIECGLGSARSRISAA